MNFEDSLATAARLFVATQGEQAAVEHFEKAILDGIRKTFPILAGGDCDVHSVGSTARRTQDLAPKIPDFDLWIVFRNPLTSTHVEQAQKALPRFNQFVRDSKAFKEFCKCYFPEDERVTLEDEAFRPFPKSVTNPENYIGKVYIRGSTGDRRLLIDIGMVPTACMKSGVRYTMAFLAQAASWSETERANVSANIRLFKAICKELDLYDRRSGGVRSIGVEQLVVQSKGSFQTLMDNFYRHAIASDDGTMFTIRPLESVAAEWQVVNPGFSSGHIFHNILQFLDRTTENTGERGGDHNWYTLATLAHTFHLEAEDGAFDIPALVSRVKTKFRSLYAY